MRLKPRTSPTRETADEPFEQADLPKNEGAAIADKGPRPQSVYRTYHRWVHISRLAMGAFIIMAGVTFAWLIPWMPSGLDTKDYTAQVGFTVYLLLGVAVLGIISLFVQERTRQNRESLMVWSTVYDETTGLHNRTYLFDRLSLECERARRNNELFSVIVLQVRGGNDSGKPTKGAASLPSDALRKISSLIDSMTHPGDLVSVLSSHELVVLVSRVDRDARHKLQQRLSEAVAGKLPDLLPADARFDVKTGAATYGADGNEPSALVQAARTQAALGAHNRPKAA